MKTETDKATEVLQIAQRLFARDADWVTFFREILGLDGAIRQEYPTRESLSEFERTEAYAEIQHMLARLRERQSDTPIPQEKTKVITVRLPKSLHEALWEESHEYRTSMNKLCISKLLQFINHELVPAKSFHRAAAVADPESKKAGAEL